MNNTKKNPFQVIPLQIWLLFLDAILVNIGFLVAFFVRSDLPFAEHNFVPYKKTFAFLTAVFLFSLSLLKVYKGSFKSSWDFFKRVFGGLFLGSLFNVALIYILRANLGGFPTSVFIISFFINLFLITKVNQYFLKAKKRIKKQVIIIGNGKVDGIVNKKANVVKKQVDQIGELLDSSNIDEIVVSEKITNAKDLNLLLLVEQKYKAKVLFSPLIYIELLSEKINGHSSIYSLSTFIGRKRDLDELLINIFDIIVSIVVLLLSSPLIIFVALLIKMSSQGSLIYKQKRAGKDGEIFTLYKFRTMIEKSGFSPAVKGDPRITNIGKWLRMTRLDELPQLLNVLKGQMSLVGPRPENIYRVEKHKALQGIRLAVKPGVTGLAQIRSYYDLHPKHKIKYDFLYIQKRSFILNVFILLQTIPVIFLRKGW